MNLCISVMFLDPLFHGKGDEDPEWPPSPMRLFQALLAGARTGARGPGWDDARARAFEWLENRPAPLIIGPAARRATRFTLYVPNNDGDKKFHRQDRLTGKLAWPHRLSDGDTVYFVWAFEDDAVAQPCVQILCKEARHLLALGWGIDQVVGNGRVLSDLEVFELPGSRWRPWVRCGSGVPTWRIPIAGSLEDLERVHQSLRRRIAGQQYNPPLKLSAFDTVEYLSAAMIPPRSYAVFELPEGVAFRQEHLVAVAAMLRSLACRHAKKDSHQFPGGSESYVAGHRPGREDGRFVDERWPRFSYLPIPSIGHEHADGMIRRVLIVEPFGGDGSHAGWAQQRLRNQILCDQDGNERGVLLDRWRQSTNGMLALYVGEHRTWSSITPVILPGFDDGKRAKADRLFLRAVEQAGLPMEAISEFTLRKAPFRKGLHPNQYRRPDYLDSGRGRRFSAWHAHVSFRDPVAGPITIGAGRHIGLGIFATADDAAQQQNAAPDAARRR